MVYAMNPARCHVSEGLMPERNVDVKEAPEERRQLKLTHAWQLRTTTDKSRLLTDRRIASNPNRTLK